MCLFVSVIGIGSNGAEFPDAILEPTAKSAHTKPISQISNMCDTGHTVLSLAYRPESIRIATSRKPTYSGPESGYDHAQKSIFRRGWQADRDRVGYGFSDYTSSFI